jgi:hypothetical protein
MLTLQRIDCRKAEGAAMKKNLTEKERKQKGLKAGIIAGGIVALLYALISFITVLILSATYIPENPTRSKFASKKAPAVSAAAEAGAEAGKEGAEE